MIKINKSNKSIIAILLLTLIMSQNLNAFGLWKKMKTCRHIKSCFYSANQYYLFYAKILQGFMVLHLAKFLTRYMRSRVRSNIALSNGFYSSPLIFFPAYRTNPPYPNYRRSRYLEGEKRFLEAANVSSIEELLKFDEEEEEPHMERIADVTDMETAKKIACEGVKIDSDFYKGGFEIIKTFYKMHLKRVHFLETKENRPLDYFNMNCFVDPKNEVKNEEEEVLSEAESYLQQKIQREYYNSIFETFNISNIDIPEELENFEEMFNDGSNYEGSAITTIPLSNDLANNFNVLSADDEEKILEDLS